jgi:CTP:molybdopterin cytidylyltransferase MocA
LLTLSQVSAALFKIQTNKLIAAQLMAAAQVSVALFKITTCKHDVVPKQAAAQVSVALSEVLISKLPAGQALTIVVALHAAPRVNVALFKTLTDKPTVAPQLAGVKANAALSEITTCRLCVALKPEVAQVSADLFETPI